MIFLELFLELFLETISKRRQHQKKIVSYATTTRRPSVNAVEFIPIQNPKRNNALSYSATVRGSEHVYGSNDFPLPPSQSRKVNFSDLHVQFAAIPNIGRTMELFGELVTKLQSTEAHNERLVIMMQYCCPQNAA